MDKVLERIVACIGPKHGAKKELADHLGIHPNVITNWLGGRNKSYMKYLDQIADFYDVSEHYLKTGEEVQKEKPIACKDDELIAFYGEVKDKLDEDDKEDLIAFMRIKAQLKDQENKK